MSETCQTCGKKFLPIEKGYPANRRDLGRFHHCACIRWPTMGICFSLSIQNAKNLSTTSETLLRFSAKDVVGRLELAAKTGDPNIPDEEVAKLSVDVEYSQAVMAFSLAVLGLQELGKARIAERYYRERKDMAYKEYSRRILNHQGRVAAGIEQLEELQLWHPLLKKRNFKLEDIRQASLYVDYQYNLGIWVGPTAIALPEDRVTPYSRLLLLSLIQSWSIGTTGHQLDRFLVAGERFNLIAYALSVALSVKNATISLDKRAKEVTEELSKLPILKKSVRIFNVFDEASVQSKGDPLRTFQIFADYLRATEPGIAEFTDKFIAELIEQSKHKDLGNQ